MMVNDDIHAAMALLFTIRRLVLFDVAVIFDERFTVEVRLFH